MNRTVDHSVIIKCSRGLRIYDPWTPIHLFLDYFYLLPNGMELYGVHFSLVLSKHQGIDEAVGSGV